MACLQAPIPLILYLIAMNSIIKSLVASTGDQVEYQKASRDLPQEQTCKDNPQADLPSVALDAGQYGCQKEAGEESPQVAKVVDVCGHIAEEQQEGHEEDDHEDDLEFEDKADPAEGRPVDDDRPDADSDHAVQTGRGACLQHFVVRVRGQQIAEDVARYSRKNVDDRNLQLSKSVLQAAHEQQQDEDVADEVQHVHVQELRHDEPVDLPLVDLVRVVHAHQAERIEAHLHHRPRRVEPQSQLHDIHSRNDQDEDGGEGGEVDGGAEGILEHDVVALLVGVHHCHLPSQEENLMVLDIRYVLFCDPHSEKTAVHFRVSLSPLRLVAGIYWNLSGHLGCLYCKPIVARKIPLHKSQLLLAPIYYNNIEHSYML